MPEDPNVDKIVTSVVVDNVKTVAGQVSVLANLSLQNTINHQLHMQALQEAAVGTLMKRMVELDPSEASAILKTTQADLGAQMMGLISALSSGQQGTKVAQTTPPETGSGGG